jgi:hypothetical protein
MDLLFKLATWHGLAKLRLHTDTTLGYLETSTTRLGKCIRTFASKTCAAFVTRELPSEETARRRRTAAKNTTGAGGVETGRKIKTLNLSTYKMHTLGDYVSTIRRYGTTDNYSTQTVCDVIDSLTIKLIGYPSGRVGAPASQKVLSDDQQGPIYGWHRSTSAARTDSVQDAANHARQQQKIQWQPPPFY